MEIKYDKVVYGNTTIKTIISDIEDKVDEVMRGETCYPIPANSLALSLLIKDLTKGYKRSIPEVVHYFVKKYGYK